MKIETNKAAICHGVCPDGWSTERTVGATYLNCLTSTFVVRAAIPMTFVTEEELIEAALSSLCSIPPHALRIVIMPNTLVLNECLVSEAVAEELRSKPGIELERNPEDFRFDEEKRLLLRVR